MMHRGSTGGQAAAKALVEVGVRCVFGIPGVREIELFDALVASGIEVTLVTHEHSAAVMADAYFRSTGMLGAFAVTSGPGVTNALTGIAEARADSVPVLGLVTSMEESVRFGSIHEMDQEAVLKDIAKAVFRPCSPADIHSVVKRAALCSKNGEPGPVIIEFPPDWLWTSARGNSPVVGEGQNPPTPIENGMDEIVARLKRSQAIGIYAGAGAMDAHENLLTLAEILQAPVSTTISGRGVIPEDHPLSVGCGFGSSGPRVARRTFRNVHTLLAVGCRFSQAATGSYGFKMPPELIHIDSSPRVIGAQYPATASLVCNAGDALKSLVLRLSDYPRPIKTELLNTIRSSKESREREVLNSPLQKGKVHPARLLRVLRRFLPHDAILTTDSGCHQFWTLSDFPVLGPRTFLSPTDFQTMGYGLPAAIAAKIALPERTVACVIGDGGFLMEGMELLTAASRGISLLVVILRDGHLGFIRENQLRLYGRAVATELSLPSINTLAEALGVGYLKISQDAELESVLSQANSMRGPVIAEACVAYNEPSPYVRGANWSYFLGSTTRVRFALAKKVGSRIMHDCLSLPARGWGRR